MVYCTEIIKSRQYTSLLNPYELKFSQQQKDLSGIIVPLFMQFSFHLFLQNDSYYATHQTGKWK